MPISRRAKHDIAYGCFLAPGVASLIAAWAGGASMDTGTAGTMGFLVLVPLALVAVISVPVGFTMSFVFRSDRVLSLLSLLTALMVVEIVTEAGSVAFYNAAGLVYGLIVLMLEAIWFAFRRRRAYPT